MFWIVMFLAQAAAVPSQTERGEALFLDAQQGCASCHALKGKGTAVGPDLTGLGRLAPQAIAMAARSTVTQYVQVVKLKAGGSFPAMTGKKDEKSVVLFDLSKNPPILHRKELLLPSDHPQVPTFAALTQQLESLSFFQDARRIGLLREWQERSTLPRSRQQWPRLDRKRSSAVFAY